MTEKARGRGPDKVRRERSNLAWRRSGWKTVTELATRASKSFASRRRVDFRRFHTRPRRNKSTMEMRKNAFANSPSLSQCNFSIRYSRPKRPLTLPNSSIREFARINERIKNKKRLIYRNFAATHFTYPKRSQFESRVCLPECQ